MQTKLPRFSANVLGISVVTFSRCDQVLHGISQETVHYLPDLDNQNGLWQRYMLQLSCQIGHDWELDWQGSKHNGLFVHGGPFLRHVGPGEETPIKNIRILKRAFERSLLLRICNLC